MPDPAEVAHECEPAWDGELEDVTRLFQSRMNLRREVARLEQERVLIRAAFGPLLNGLDGRWQNSNIDAVNRAKRALSS